MQQNLVQSSIPSPPNSKPSGNDKVEYVNSYDKDYVYKQCSYVVKSSLKTNLNIWKNGLKVNKYISDIAEFGFKIPFLQEPPVVHQKNNLSAKNHADFVNCAIQELLDVGCIEEYTT